MFLLLLMGLGAASVKAQVRIGGNTPPSAAAVLDLNATDAANTGTGGLVLPRVNLTSNTMQLTTGVNNIIGTMVYNTTATLGAIGVYFWNGNNWVRAGLPTPTPTDSGYVLMWDGTKWTYHYDLFATTALNADTVTMLPSPSTSTWTKVVSATFTITRAYPIGSVLNIAVPNLLYYDVCKCDISNGWPVIHTLNGLVRIYFLYRSNPVGNFNLVCFRPSL